MTGIFTLTFGSKQLANENIYVCGEVDADLTIT